MRMRAARVTGAMMPGLRGGDNDHRNPDFLFRGDITVKWTVVTAAGDLDVAGGPRLRQRLLEAVEQDGPHIVVDLTRVNFIDSAGIGVLAGLLVRVRPRGGDVRLAVAPGAVEALLGITGLDRVFTLYRTVAEATGD